MLSNRSKIGKMRIKEIMCKILGVEKSQDYVGANK